MHKMWEAETLVSTYPHKYDNAAPVYKDKDGNLWVSHADLLENDYENIEDFDIIYLNEHFYELQGYVQKANAWWIEPVEMEVKDAPPEEEAESSQAVGE